MGIINIWDLNWFLYLLGFIFLPRINLMFALCYHGSLYWDYLSFLYGAGWLFMPRMLTGIIVALLTQNHVLGVFLTIIGFLMDGGTKYGFWKFKHRRKWFRED